jgi:Trk-type K+ transport system membrane component
MMKILKNRNKILKQLTELLKIGLGCERLFFFILLFFLALHLAACFWLICASILTDESTEADNFEGTWLYTYKTENENLSVSDMYVLAIYWAVQTATTVGYGDISSVNSTERLFCASMMVIGVMAFSFANGALSSIIQNYDLSNAEYHERMETLNKIY